MALNKYMSSAGGMKSARMKSGGKRRNSASSALGVIGDERPDGDLASSMSLSDVFNSGAPELDSGGVESQEVATSAMLSGLKDGLGLDDDMAVERRRRRRDLFGLEVA